MHKKKLYVYSVQDNDKGRWIAYHIKQRTRRIIII